ncbi:DNA polymerase I, partial [Candidatus Acetothermia bacterium]
DLGITQSEAKGYIDRFFNAYPKTKEYIDRLVELATERGYAETLLGRRRPLPHLRSRNVPQRNFDRRNAVNTPIQGSAADLIKLAMIRIDRLIEHEGLRVKMLLQIHDELIFEVAEEEGEEAGGIIKDEMENVLSLRLPLEVKIAMGKNWEEI